MSNFGQIMALFDTSNMAQASAANYLIARKKQKGEERIAEQRLAHEQQMYEMDAGFRERQLQAQMTTSRRRDALFKEIALYAGIGAGILAILITVGVLMVSSKGENEYEYEYEYIDG